MCSDDLFQSTPIDTVILTVGNDMMGDDGAGPLLAKMLLDASLPMDWRVIDGGVLPENEVHVIRELQPRRVVVVDATEMGLEPGEIRRINPDLIDKMFIMSTHDMPLTFLFEQLASCTKEVVFIGIQPQTVAFYYPISEIVVNQLETFVKVCMLNNVESIEILSV